MVFELRDGLFFKYDATVRSWIKIASAGVEIPLATVASAGAMSAVDLKKLNRLVFPPPLSSITGTDCDNPFSSGNIGLYSGDKFVNVEGTLKVQNIGQTGDLVSQDVPFQIHQHTYGFDFTVDLPELVEELKLRKQFNMTGKKGAKGDTGRAGPDGPDAILTGPPGDSGVDGSALACSITAEPDDLQAEPHEGMTKALVGGKVVFDEADPLKYKIIFDRQLVGPVGYAADKVRVQADNSSWLVAVTGDQSDSPIRDPRTKVVCGTSYSAGRPQQIYYVDIEPIVNAIRDKFLQQAQLVRESYQNVVKFWVQTMSDLFDEQKSALCCALEHCRSIKKNAEVRHDIESLAAAAAGSANVLLHGRNSDEAVNLSSTRTLRQLGSPDLCKGGAKFPQYPNLPSGGVSGFEGDEREGDGVSLQTLPDAVDEAQVTLDPLLHSTLSTAVQVPLLAGDYTAVLTRADAGVNNKHRANAKLQHSSKGVSRTVQFLDKGEFDSVVDAKQAYEGLGLSFQHDGGMLSVWLPSLAPTRTSGAVEIAIKRVRQSDPEPIPLATTLRKVEEVESEIKVEASPEVDGCSMTVAHLAWYERGWESGNCCGMVLNVMGQDYIIVKRSIGTDMACGGGESDSEPCVTKFKHPAFAWPTLDGETFAPLPDTERVSFQFDEKLNALVAGKITDGDYEKGKGNPNGVRHLAYQLTTVLFPSS